MTEMFYGGNKRSYGVWEKQDDWIELRVYHVRGRKPLDRRQMENFKAVVEHYAEEIVQKWIDYFVLHRPVSSERIIHKIR